MGKVYKPSTTVNGPAAKPGAVASAASAGVQKPTARAIPERKGASSNYYLNKLLQAPPQSLTAADRQAVSILIKDNHRITPVSKAKAKKGFTVFNATTGYHEWIPTDCVSDVTNSIHTIWKQLFTGLRSPTWLLILDPQRYSTVQQAQYQTAIATAAGRAVHGGGNRVTASALGLVGHSGGLCDANQTQLTTHQSTWHDELRRIFVRHEPTGNHAAYWADLIQFIHSNFLFVTQPVLPTMGANTLGMSDAQWMGQIDWDLNVSNRGNPDGLVSQGRQITMHDIALYLNQQWAESMAYLRATYIAWSSN